MSPYIQSLRLRTLPLSVSGIILGTGLAASETSVSWLVFLFAILTTLSLQILSNLSNELGDAQKGTDSNQQGRQAYGLQSGQLTIQNVWHMIYLFITLSVLFGLALIYCAFGSLFCLQSLIFIGLGLFAIVGAMTYTLGKHSYGYIGLGDLGVLLFFGLLSTIGGFYLQTHTLSLEVFWMGMGIGFPCVGVLNLNNIRDMNNDIEHGKRTFASLLGPRLARLYHTLLLIACLLIMCLYGHLWTLCIIPLWTWHLYYVWTHTQQLDKQMPILMFSTLICAFLALI